MTRNVDAYQGLEKEYEGSFTLGETTPGYDREKPPDATFPVAHITGQAIYDLIPQFTGKITQLPPPHSAVRVGGKRAYALARKGKSPEVQPREVEIIKFEITHIRLPEVGFRVVCSKGTYIRSLVHDFGRRLDSGATLDTLRRTRIGPYHVDQAWTLAAFEERLRLQDPPR
jgi:tRNA pseudouridine55 synthase